MLNELDKCAEHVSEEVVTTPIFEELDSPDGPKSTLRDLFNQAGFDNHDDQRVLVGWIYHAFSTEMALFEQSNFRVN
tara:strand:- start:1338 stop:1568 length:231 start_codon:yes stop_codon:yes gene_type:complete